MDTNNTVLFMKLQKTSVSNYSKLKFKGNQNDFSNKNQKKSYSVRAFKK